jgi:hypothetical protein
MLSDNSNQGGAILVKRIQNFFGEKIENIEKTSLGKLSSANGAVASRNSGVCKLDVYFSNGESCSLALKSKSQRTLVNGIILLSKNSPRLRLDLILNHKVFGYNNSHRREISVYQKIDKILGEYIVKYRGSFRTILKTYNLLFDYYEPNSKKLTLKITKKILDEILSFHVLYYGDIEAAQDMGLNIYSPGDYRRAKKCIYELYNSRHDENVRLYGKKRNERINDYIKNIDKTIEQYSYHRSFTHNDFSTRNIFFNKNKVLFYDFELSCYQNPEHDLIEFLMYDLGSFEDDEAMELIDYYKRGLRQSGIDISDQDYDKLLLYNTYEFIVNRLSMTKTINDNVELDFAKLSVPNSVRLLKILEARSE